MTLQALGLYAKSPGLGGAMDRADKSMRNLINMSGHMSNLQDAQLRREHAEKMNPLLQSIAENRVDQLPETNRTRVLANDAQELNNSSTAVQNMSERDKAALYSMATGAAQIMPLLEAGDTEGAIAVLTRRQNNLIEAGIDAGDTQEAIEMLQAGDIQGVAQMGQELMKLSGLTAPEELKVGRYRQIELPDGSIASLDTATNRVTPISEAQPIDLSSLPEEVRGKVEGLPREMQQKAVEGYISPKGQEAQAAQVQKQEKAMEVATKTRALVNELLSNVDGVKSAVGGLDEFTPTFRRSTKDAEAALDDLRNLLTVENLGIMSGVLSESDMRVIQSVGAAGLSGSQDRVLDTLRKMQQSLNIDQGSQPSSVGRFKVRVK